MLLSSGHVAEETTLSLVSCSELSEDSLPPDFFFSGDAERERRQREQQRSMQGVVASGRRVWHVAAAQRAQADHVDDKRQRGAFSVLGERDDDDDDGPWQRRGEWQREWKRKRKRNRQRHAKHHHHHTVEEAPERGHHSRLRLRQSSYDAQPGGRSAQNEARELILSWLRDASVSRTLCTYIHTEACPKSIRPLLVP